MNDEQKKDVKDEEESVTNTVSSDSSDKEKTKEIPAQAIDNDGAEIEIPTQFKDLIEQIESMSVLELHNLVKVLEKKFGVSAAAVSAAPQSADGDSAAEEKLMFDVELTDAGAQKIQVIKAIKEVLGLGLKEAKDLVDGAPSIMKQGMKKPEAEELKAKVESAGGKVNLK